MCRFRYFSLFIIALIVFSIFAIPAHFQVPKTKPIGPLLDSNVHKGYQKIVNQEKPKIVLLGDSYLDTGIDEAYLNELTNEKIVKIAKHGSASAMWYLLIKNNIVTARNKPAYIVVFFRGTMLTTPEFRTTGTYLTNLDEFASPDDRLFVQLAYVSQMSKFEQFLDQYIPLYAYRQLIRTSIDRMLKYPLPARALDKDTEEVNLALNNAFGDPEIAQLNAIINAAEMYLYKPSKLDFESQLPRSFLPEIVDLCRNNDIQLVLVREKVIEFSTEAQQPKGLTDYTRSLEAYLNEKHVIFFDLAFDPRIKKDYFYDSLHMTEEGKMFFTEIFAQELSSGLP